MPKLIEPKRAIKRVLRKYGVPYTAELVGDLAGIVWKVAEAVEDIAIESALKVAERKARARTGSIE